MSDYDIFSIDLGAGFPIPELLVLFANSDGQELAEVVIGTSSEITIADLNGLNREEVIQKLTSLGWVIDEEPKAEIRIGGFSSYLALKKVIIRHALFFEQKEGSEVVLAVMDLDDMAGARDDFTGLSYEAALEHAASLGWVVDLILEVKEPNANYSRAVFFK